MAVIIIVSTCCLTNTHGSFYGSYGLEDELGFIASDDARRSK